MVGFMKNDDAKLKKKVKLMKQIKIKVDVFFCGINFYVYFCIIKYHNGKEFIY